MLLINKIKLHGVCSTYTVCVPFLDKRKMLYLHTSKQKHNYI